MNKLVILWLLSVTCLLAGHPLISDDASTVGKRTLQVELLPDFLLKQQTYEYNFPIALTYGLAYNLDLVAEMPFCVVCDHSKNQRFYSGGWNEPAVSVKWILFQHSGWSGALKPSVVFPWESKLFDQSNQLKPALSVLLTKTLVGGQVSMNMGYLWNRGADENLHHLWFISSGFEYRLSEKISLAWDMMGEKNADQKNVVNVYLINGVQYNLSENMMLSIGILSGLDKTNTELRPLFGMTWVL